MFLLRSVWNSTLNLGTLRWCNVGFLLFCVLLVLTRCDNDIRVTTQDGEGADGPAKTTDASSSVAAMDAGLESAVTQENYAIQTHVNATPVSSITSSNVSGLTSTVHLTHKTPAATPQGLAAKTGPPEGKPRKRKDACAQPPLQGNCPIFPL